MEGLKASATSPHLFVFTFTSTVRCRSFTVMQTASMVAQASPPLSSALPTVAVVNREQLLLQWKEAREQRRRAEAKPANKAKQKRPTAASAPASTAAASSAPPAAARVPLSALQVSQPAAAVKAAGKAGRATAVEPKPRWPSKGRKGEREMQQRKRSREEEEEEGKGEGSARSSRGCNAVLAVDAPELAASIAWTKPKAAQQQRTAAEQSRGGERAGDGAVEGSEREAAARTDALGSVRSRLERWAATCAQRTERTTPSPSTPHRLHSASPAYLALLSRASELLRRRQFPSALRTLRDATLQLPSQALGSSELYIFLAYAEEHAEASEGGEGLEGDGDSRACAAFSKAVDVGAQPAGDLLDAFHSFERRRVNRALDSAAAAAAQHGSIHSLHHPSATAAAPVSAPATPSAARLPPAAAPPMTPLSALLRKYRAAHPEWDELKGRVIATTLPEGAADAPLPPATPRSAALRARWTHRGEEHAATEPLEAARTPRSAQLRHLRLTPDSFEAPQQPRSPRSTSEEPSQQPTTAVEQLHRADPHPLSPSPPSSLPVESAEVSSSSRLVVAGPACTCESSAEAASEGLAGEGRAQQQPRECASPQLARSLMDDWLEAERERADGRSVCVVDPSTALGSASSIAPPRSPLQPLPLVEFEPTAAEREDGCCIMEDDDSASDCSPAPAAAAAAPSLFVESEFVAGLSTPRCSSAHSPHRHEAAPPASSLHSLLPSSHGPAQRRSPASLALAMAATCAAPSPSSSLVLLQPLRAGRHLRQSLGAAVFLSPVRRSARNFPPAPPSVAASPQCSHAEVVRLLTATGFAFLPNAAAQPTQPSAARRSPRSPAEPAVQPQSCPAELPAVGRPTATVSSPSALPLRRQGTPAHRRSSFALLPPPPLQHPTLIVLQPVRPPPSSSSSPSTASMCPSSSSSSPACPALGFASPVRRSARHSRAWAASSESVRQQLLSGQVELRANQALGDREDEWRQRREERESRDRRLMPPPQPRLPTASRRGGGGVLASPEEAAAAPAGRFEGGRRTSTPRPTGKRRSRTDTQQQQQQRKDEEGSDEEEEQSAAFGRRKRTRLDSGRRRSTRLTAAS